MTKTCQEQESMGYSVDQEKIEYMEELKKRSKIIYQELMQLIETCSVIGVTAANIPSIDDVQSSTTLEGNSPDSSNRLSMISEQEESETDEKTCGCGTEGETCSKENSKVCSKKNRTQTQSDSVQNQSQRTQAKVLSASRTETRTNRSSNRSTTDEVTRTNYDVSKDQNVNQGKQKKPSVSEQLTNKLVRLFRSRGNKQSLTSQTASSSTPSSSSTATTTEETISNAARVRFDVQNPDANNQVYNPNDRTKSSHEHNLKVRHHQRLPTNIFDYLFGKWGGKKHLCGVAYSEY